MRISIFAAILMFALVASPLRSHAASARSDWAKQAVEKELIDKLDREMSERRIDEDVIEELVQKLSADRLVPASYGRLVAMTEKFDAIVSRSARSPFEKEARMRSNPARHILHDHAEKVFIREDILASFLKSQTDLSDVVFRAHYNAEIRHFSEGHIEPYTDRLLSAVAQAFERNVARAKNPNEVSKPLLAMVESLKVSRKTLTRLADLYRVTTDRVWATDLLTANPELMARVTNKMPIPNALDIESLAKKRRLALDVLVAPLDEVQLPAPRITIENRAEMLDAIVKASSNRINAVLKGATRRSELGVSLPYDFKSLMAEPQTLYEKDLNNVLNLLSETRPTTPRLAVPGLVSFVQDVNLSDSRRLQGLQILARHGQPDERAKTGFLRGMQLLKKPREDFLNDLNGYVHEWSLDSEQRRLILGFLEKPEIQKLARMDASVVEIRRRAIGLVPCQGFGVLAPKPKK